MRPAKSPPWAHPRSRGEHKPKLKVKPGVSGSSPLARGTLVRPVWDGIQSGLIPARAGNTAIHCTTRRVRRAHPRSRGEHWHRCIRSRRAWGSSPLARGTPPGGARLTRLWGLIPARAGNTVSARDRVEIEGAHPRSRGEHLSTSVSATVRPGSSPLARGTLVPCLARGKRGGLIPARAGNTWCGLPP